MSSYNQAWKQLIASHIDLAQPVNRLTSAQIKSVGKEPRLMTKFDSRAARPEVLRENDLFLLPETNGSYLLLREEGYCDLEFPPVSNDVIEDYEARFPIRFEALEQAQSEMNHLDRLFLCGLIGKFIGTERLWATIRGRRFAPHFSYEVGELGTFQARGVQYEVDQGYETADEIVLFEAKNTTPSDFLTRQLYFPFRVFSTTCRKPIRNVFFNCDASSGVCSFFEFEFSDKFQYQSICLKQQKHYRIRFPELAPVSLLDELLAKPLKISEKGWEIPQADDFGKIMDFALRIAEGYDDSGLMATAFDFAERQSSYYRRACEQMGLVTTQKGRYVLTDAGEDYLMCTNEERTRIMIEKMLQQPIVRVVLEEASHASDGVIRMARIEKHIEERSHVGGDTVKRRAKSVCSWLRWLQNALGELQVDSRILTVE